MSVVVLRVSATESDQIRKMSLTLPVPPLRNSQTMDDYPTPKD